MVGDTVNVSGQSNCTPVKVPECRLSEDLGQLFQSSSFSDVFLSVGGHEFRVHKSILAGGWSLLLGVDAAVNSDSSVHVVHGMSELSASVRASCRMNVSWFKSVKSNQ